MKSSLLFVKKYFLILFGSAVAAVGLDLFLVPCKLTSGGVSGISTVVHYLSGASIGLLVVIINIPIFIMGGIIFGQKSLISSIVGTLALSFFIDFLSFIPKATDDIMLAAIFGGTLMGIGLGIVLREGATTGGTDIIAKVLQKYFPGISLGQFILVVDALIIAFAGIVFKRWEISLYSGIAIFISTKVIDALVEGVDFAKSIYIVSDKPEEISEFIIKQMERGVTGLKGVSMYNGSDKMILMCVLKKHEISRLKQAIKDIDKEAFLILGDVREVLGNGFKMGE